jgi:hypothetical protein
LLDFFVCPPCLRVFVVGFLLLFAPFRLMAADFITYEPKSGAGQGKYIVFLAGDEEYRSEEGLPMLAKILSRRHGFRCTVLFSMNKSEPDVIDPTNQTSLSHSEALDSADAIVMLLRYRHWPGEDMKHFVGAVNRGVPIIALRTSTHAFNYPQSAPTSLRTFNKFGKETLGEGWVNHWGNHKKEATRGIVEPSAKDNAILRGVSHVFGDSDVYEAYPPADATTLLRGVVLKGMNPSDPPADYRKKRADGQEQDINDPMMAVAWTRQHKNDAGKTNRIFCTTMGAATDLANEGLRRLVVNAVYWGLEFDVPAKADVDFVDEFHPSPFGFGGQRKNLKPDDFVVGKSLPAR